MLGRSVIVHARVGVILAVLMLVIPLAACGGSSSPAGLDGTIGYWRADTIEGTTPGHDAVALIRVEKRGREYYLGVNGQPPQPAKFADGRILLPWSSESGQPIEFGLGAGQPAVFTPESGGQSPGPSPSGNGAFGSAPVTMLSQTEYEQLAADWAEGRLQSNLTSLYLLLLEWRMDHDLPAADGLTQDSEFGRWVGSQEMWPGGPTGWPRNWDAPRSRCRHGC